MSYEFWIPALSIALACGALLIDISALDGESPDDDEADAAFGAAFGAGMAQIGDADLAKDAEQGADWGKIAANSPQAPDGQA